MNSIFYVPTFMLILYLKIKIVCVLTRMYNLFAITVYYIALQKNVFSTFIYCSLQHLILLQNPPTGITTPKRRFKFQLTKHPHNISRKKTYNWWQKEKNVSVLTLLPVLLQSPNDILCHCYMDFQASSLDPRESRIL